MPRNNILITQSARHLHLVDVARSLRALLIIKTATGSTEIYFEELSCLSGAISRKAHRKVLSRDKMGDNLSFAYDEGKRLLAVCNSSHVCYVRFPGFYKC